MLSCCKGNTVEEEASLKYYSHSMTFLFFLKPQPCIFVSDQSYFVFFEIVHICVPQHFVFYKTLHTLSFVDIRFPIFFFCNASFLSWCFFPLFFFYFPVLQSLNQAISTYLHISHLTFLSHLFEFFSIKLICRLFEIFFFHL